MLNVSINELYPDKTNYNRDYSFCITFFISVKLYSVLAAKCYLHLSVNKFKTLDKTKIPEIVPRRPLHHRSDFIYQVKSDD